MFEVDDVVDVTAVADVEVGVYKMLGDVVFMSPLKETCWSAY